VANFGMEPPPSHCSQLSFCAGLNSPYSRRVQLHLDWRDACGLTFIRHDSSSVRYVGRQWSAWATTLLGVRLAGTVSILSPGIDVRDGSAQKPPPAQVCKCPNLQRRKLVWSAAQKQMILGSAGGVGGGRPSA
jgi:hypothetical protein